MFNDMNRKDISNW